MPAGHLGLGALLVSTTIAESRQTGAVDARQLKIRRILVTAATLSQSIIYTRALRDAKLLAGGREGAGAWPGSQAGEKEEGSNKLATSLQHACNMPATMAIRRHCYGVASLPTRGP